MPIDTTPPPLLPTQDELFDYATSTDCMAVWLTGCFGGASAEIPKWIGHVVSNGLMADAKYSELSDYSLGNIVDGTQPITLESSRNVLIELLNRLADTPLNNEDLHRYHCFLSYSYWAFDNIHLAISPETDITEFDIAHALPTPPIE